MKKKYKKCSACKLKKASVRRRRCIFILDVHGETKMEQICDECEYEHAMDI